MGVTTSPDSARAPRAGFAMPRWPGWSRLPRDARDALFLLGVIGWTVLPHADHLPLWCLALSGSVLAWRAALALSNRPLPSRWAVMAVLLLATALTFWTHRTLLGKDAGVTMLVVLMVLKTLELRARRDALVVFFLGFFLVLTNFLYSQSLLVGLAMVGAVWGLLTALVLAHMPVGRPRLTHAGSLAARAALWGAPIMVVLFLFFPRLPPLWGLPHDAMGRTGLSGSLSLGGVAELANDDSIAFRVRFEGIPPSPNRLYWRGPVLSTFDGREWRRVAHSFPPGMRLQANLRPVGQGLAYEMVLEPSRLPLLPLLEVSASSPTGVVGDDGLTLTLGDDLQWTVNRPITERIGLRAQAWTRFDHGPTQPLVGLQDYLTLPPGYNPRTLAWAAGLRRTPALAEADALTLTRAVLAHIQTENFGYTLTPGLYGDDSGRHAIDEFWFDRRLGFCEHFASAFVVIMRALDVPARIVTGYQGADEQLQDGWLVVRQSHAHAWAEVWQAGRGWVRVDPTAAIAPDRVQRSANLRPAPGFMAEAIQSVSPALLTSLRSGWERINHHWNQWVLGYSRGNQFELMRWLGFDTPTWQDLGVLMVLLISGAALAGAGWATWDRWRQDPWQRLHRRVRERLQSVGVSSQAHEAPRALATRVQERLGPAGQPVSHLLLALDRQRYARDAGPLQLGAWWREFSRAAAALPRPSRPARPGMRLASLWLAAATLLAAAVAALLPDVASASPKKPQGAAVRHDREPDTVIYGARDDVRALAAELARAHALDDEWVLAQISQARFVPAVTRLIMPPPAGTAKNWAAYRARFVEPARIRAGLEFWRTHEQALARAESTFGVPAELVVGIIGVETYYGRIMGSFRVLDALATLSLDFPTGRRDRSAFFRDELGQLLAWAHREGLDPASVRGSFAGAVGLPQFMPGSINRYGVDFDGDGHIDLRGNPVDAIGSVARYLADFGWQRGMPTHYPVAAPVDVTDRALLLGPDIVPSFTADEFAARGAELSPAGRQHEGLLALVELQNGAAAPSYVAGTRNFYAVTRYNWSSYYALAVIDLGAAIAAERGGAGTRSATAGPAAAQRP